MPTILVTNDDGVHSPGLLALKQGLAALGTVIVLAPERNWSASSHAKTMHKPLRMQAVTLADGSEAHASSGSPTDCVAMAAAGVLGAIPDLVVSGINAGYNLGIDVTYSGTVACAMEATIKGMAGIAVSTVWPGQQGGTDMQAIYRRAAEIACQLVEQVLLRGLHITRIGSRQYPNDEVIRREDPYGRPYYWLGGGAPVDVHDDRTDVGAVANGFVSVTPITLDMTNYAFLPDLERWDLQLEGRPAAVSRE
jgi:5'-nucleotidase